MKKYRIRLVNDRVVGPFNVKQIAELYLKGHIKGKESCQLFPTGDWLPITNFPEIVDIVKRLASGAITLEDLDEEDDTSVDKTIVKLSLAQKAKIVQEKLEEKDDKGQVIPTDFHEFKFDKNKKTETSPDYQKLEEEYKRKKSEEEKLQVSNERSKAEAKVEEESDDELEKTRVVTKNALKKAKPTEDEDSKTRVIDPKKIPEFRADQVEAIPQETPSEEIKEMVAIDPEKKTEFIKIEEFLPDIKGQVVEAEHELQAKKKQEEEEEKKKRLEEEKKLSEEKAKEEAELENKEEEVPKKRAMKPIVALAFLAILWVLFVEDDDKPKDIQPRSAILEFPIVNETEDPIQSKEHYQKGMEYYLKDTYDSKIFAQDEFKKSLEFKFSDNEALGYLMLVDAELYPNSSDLVKSSNTISKLMQIAANKALTDINITLASAIFYSHFEKYETAVNTVENYLRLGKPSLKLLTYYLLFQVKKGDMAKARQVYEKLKALDKVDLFAHLAMAQFLEVDQQFDEAKKILENASKLNPNSVPLLLEYAKYAIRDQEIKKLISILKAVQELSAEYCPTYYAKYLEYMGMLSVFNKDIQLAAGFFKKALQIRESDELRSKLANLEIGGGKKVEELILESKSIQLMYNARIAIDGKDWEKAFKFALDAAEMAEDYIPAQLLLVEVQLSRGYYGSALDTLNRLIKKFPINKKVNFALLKALLMSYKIDEARNLLTNLSSSKDFKDLPEMASLTAHYYDQSNNFPLSIKWYQEAINRSPVNDDDYFRFAKFFVKYKKFDKAKPLISKAISLNPQNTEYRTLYASILYEYDGVDTAIGYLRDTLKDHVDDPQIIGEIAKYYYRAGLTKEFAEYKTKFDNLVKKDAKFYEFLVESAKMEDRAQDVVEYSKELIKIRPGDLNSRLTLGDYYVQKNDLKMALKTFEEIKARLPSYPKLNYWMAKIYMEMKDYTQALTCAEDEIKYNPSLEGGYVMAGEAYKAQGDFAKAERSFEKAIGVNPKASEPMAALGWLKFKQGHMEAARELHIRAIKEDSDDPALHYQLGKIYKSMGQSLLANEEFQVYLKLAPNGKERPEVEQLMGSSK